MYPSLRLFSYNATAPIIIFYSFKLEFQSKLELLPSIPPPASEFTSTDFISVRDFRANATRWSEYSWEVGQPEKNSELDFLKKLQY